MANKEFAGNSRVSMNTTSLEFQSREIIIDMNLIPNPGCVFILINSRSPLAHFNFNSERLAA